MSDRASNPHRMLVEGEDDQWSLINLLARHGYDTGDRKTRRQPQSGWPTFDACGGVTCVFDRIVPTLKTYERVGIVIDHDPPPASHWPSLRHQLLKAGCPGPLPDRPEAGGLVVVGRHPDWRVGVWVMPDNARHGAIEDFLAGLIPAENRCWPHAIEATTRACDLGAPLREGHLRKGAMHAWLAWQDPSGQPFGQAIHTRALGHASPEALAFVAWFRRLFDLEPARGPGR